MAGKVILSIFKRLLVLLTGFLATFFTPSQHIIAQPLINLTLVEPEANFDDAPVDTRDIYMNFFFRLACSALPYHSEPSVNDLPFNTACIIQKYQQAATRFNPFLSEDCRQQPARQVKLKAISLPSWVAQSIPAEGYIDDIPFNTTTVLAEHVGNRKLLLTALQNFTQLSYYKHISNLLKYFLFSLLGFILAAVAAVVWARQSRMRRS